MSLTAHIFVGAVTLSALVFVLHMVREGQWRAKYALVWLSVGGMTMILAVVPELLNRLSTALGIAYPPTLIFVLAIALLFLLVMQYSWEISRLEERTRILAERFSLLSAKQDPPPPHSSGEPDPDTAEASRFV